MSSSRRKNPKHLEPLASQSVTGTPESHAEMRPMHRSDGLRGSSHFDLRRGLAPKGIQEEFARRTAEPSQRLTRSNPHPLGSSSPLNLEPKIVQPPTQITATTANVSPQRGIHRRRETARRLAIGSANVLVMNEELVEICHGTDPFDAEESDRRARPDPPDKPRKVLALSQSGPTPLAEPRERTGQNEAWPCDGIAFS